jgi:hypothetical protein
MYCTLQEAYNIPSFVTKKKKGCMNPLAAASQVDQSQSQPIAKISADSYDAYDPYTGDSGKEHALAMNLAKNASLNGSMQEQSQSPASYPQQQSSGLSNKNSAIWGASQGMIYNRSPENFDQKGTTNPNAGMNDVPYNAQAADYKYYCNAFGICSNPAIEGFANPNNQMHTSVPASQRYPEVQQGAGAGSSQPIMFSKNGPPTPDMPGQLNTPYYGPNGMGKCSRLQTPTYEYPISDASRAQFEQGMEASLNQEQGATQHFPYAMRKANMSSVSGYYDEELEKFLTTQSQKSEKLPEPLKETPINIEPTTPIAEKQNVEKKASSFNYIQSPQYIMDLLLFIAAGILIILLCDQIFKLGMSFGMRDTVKVLMPYLEELKKVEG